MAGIPGNPRQLARRIGEARTKLGKRIVHAEPEKQITQQYIAPHHVRQITHSEAAYSPRPLSDRDALRFSTRPDRRAEKPN